MLKDSFVSNSERYLTFVNYSLLSVDAIVKSLHSFHSFHNVKDLFNFAWKEKQILIHTISMQIYKNKMKEVKMLTEKVIFVFIFFGLAFVEEWFMRSKRIVFCFWKTVILLYCNACTAKKRFRKLSTVNCNACEWWYWLRIVLGWHWSVFMTWLQTATPESWTGMLRNMKTSETVSVPLFHPPVSWLPHK